MSQKNETKILILALLITAAVVGGGFWWFKDKIIGGGSQSPTPASPSTRGDRQQRLSLGDKILVAADTTPEKQAGIEAFAKGDYTQAIAQFQSSLQVRRNDPETLIYLNNAQAVSNNPIKIAVIVPIGGNLNVAKEILRGVAQAQNSINRSGGIQGRWLQVEIVNDDNDPEVAKEVASQLVRDKNVLAVVGHNSSDATLAAAPQYQQGGLVMVSPTSDAKSISEVGGYIFRTIPSIRFQSDTLSRYTVRTAKKSNLSICIDSEAQYSQSLKEEFTSAVFADGGRVVQLDCDFSAAGFNPNGIVSQAIANGAEGLLLVPSVNRINSAIDLAKANQRRLLLLGSSTLYTFQTLAQGQESVNGMVLAVPWHPDAFQGNAFPEQAKQLWGGEVNWRTALSYDATEAIITGLKQGEIGRQGLQQTLASSRFSAQGATGEIQFLPSGDRNGAAILVKIEPGQKSGTGFDFVAIEP